MSDLLMESNGLSMDKLFKMATGIDAVTGKKSSKDSYSYSSIANAASKLVAVFPVLMSTTVSAETAYMTSKYIEQISCQFIILALQQANITNAKNGIEYLKQFHKNLDIGGSGVDAIIKAVDTWVQGYEEATTDKSNSISSHIIRENAEQNVLLDELLESDDDLVISAQDMRELNETMKYMDGIKFYDTKLNPVSINDFVVNEFDTGDYHVSIKPYILDEARGGHNPVTGHNYRYSNPDDNPHPLIYKYWNIYKEKTKHSGLSLDERQRIYDELVMDQEAEERQQDQEERANKRKSRKDEADSRVNSGKNVSILRDQDIKKMNDAAHSLLVVKFYHQDENGNVSTVPTEFIVGVKAKIVPVTTTEVLRRIMNDNKDGKKFINLMRVITGELKASDLIFGLSRIKDDVKSCKVKGAYGDTWNLLSNRAKAAREQVKRGQRNDFSAITTLCISRSDADELYQEENFDIEDPKNAFHFMQSYNLMAFAIVDDSTESMKILFDNGSKQFDEISYRMLERETQDGTYKKLINLMAASK